MPDDVLTEIDATLAEATAPVRDTIAGAVRDATVSRDAARWIPALAEQPDLDEDPAGRADARAARAAAATDGRTPPRRRNPPTVLLARPLGDDNAPWTPAGTVTSPFADDEYMPPHRAFAGPDGSTLIVADIDDDHAEDLLHRMTTHLRAQAARMVMPDLGQWVDGRTLLITAAYRRDVDTWLREQPEKPRRIVSVTDEASAARLQGYNDDSARLVTIARAPRPDARDPGHPHIGAAISYLVRAGVEHRPVVLP